MNSKRPGTVTSPIELKQVTDLGLQIRTRRGEFLLSFEDFPWFLDAPITALRNVEEPVPGHYHWPELDVDLTDEMLAHPERFPLKSRL
ncbi:DUF2442 domain-containing protein [Myxococcota bacterium]|nr:DUF2442 domain-containing protein [Myxococcota bacterium]MBU1411765.1 DUF2442 domain-containing protein [Myxococcota bacterium]MBU1509386.1 DUF2442 domain-containing protein [Myxococcota bacterium]